MLWQWWNRGNARKHALDRRMLAIMATDVVGYSRQMEADEVGTIGRVTAVRAEVIEPLLVQHRGRLVKLIGDGTLSVFDSVVDAVACAAAIQRAVADRSAGPATAEPMVLRIGVNLGDIVLLENDVYGDGVNVAARLEQLCDPGGVMVSGTAFDHLQGKLGFPLDFVGEQKVKNIRRPVRAYRARLDGAKRPKWRRWRLPLRSIAAALLALVLAGGGGWWWWSNHSAPPSNASIAVLPFDNLAGDDATSRLADGMADDLITELTRFRGLDVIARDATLAYKDMPIDVRAIGRKLDVLYLLDGTIQRQGPTVRVSARLVDTGSGRDLWSDRWDRQADDVFALQSELAEAVASRIASSYSGQIIAADREAAKRKPPKNLTAYDLYLLGMDAANRATREGMEESVQLLQRSIAADPGFARAWTGLAMTYAGLAEMTGYPADLAQERAAAASKAVALDPGDADAHAALATYYMDSDDPGRAEAEFDKALKLNPGSADLLSIYAGWASGFGDPDKGVEAAEHAMRLNPETPAWAVYNFAYAYLHGRPATTRRCGSSIGCRPIPTRRAPMSIARRLWAAWAAPTMPTRRVADGTGPQSGADHRDIRRPLSARTTAERDRLIETMRAAGFPALRDRTRRRPERGAWPSAWRREHPSPAAGACRLCAPSRRPRGI